MPAQKMLSRGNLKVNNCYIVLFLLPDKRFENHKVAGANIITINPNLQQSRLFIATAAQLGKTGNAKANRRSLV